MHYQEMPWKDVLPLSFVVAIQYYGFALLLGYFYHRQNLPLTENSFFMALFVSGVIIVGYSKRMVRHMMSRLFPPQKNSNKGLNYGLVYRR